MLCARAAGQVSSRAAGRGEQRAEHRDADEHEERRDADEHRGRRCRSCSPNSPTKSAHHRDAEDDAAPDVAPAPGGRTSTAWSRSAAIGGIRAARRAGAMRRDERDEGPDQQRHDDRARQDLQRPGREGRCRTAPSSASSGFTIAMPSASPTTDEKTPTTSASNATDPRPAGRSRRARGAARARGSAAPRDREGVVDDERADEQRDDREDEQERVEERQVVLDVVGLLLGELLAGDRLVVFGQPFVAQRRARMRSRTSVCETPESPRTSICPTGPTRFITRCAVGRRERRERRAREAVLLAAELERADEIVNSRGGTVRNEIRDLVADLEAAVLDRLLVERDLVGGARPGDPRRARATGSPRCPAGTRRRRTSAPGL